MRARVIIAALLAVAVTATAVGVVYSKHRSRRLFVQLQQLERDRDSLNVEWGRLRLEEGTWAAQGRIERVARQRLDMRMPAADDVIILPLSAGRGHEESSQ